MTTERIPVATLDDLKSLNEDEIKEGYQDGLTYDFQCGNNRSRSYWHGYRNAMIDKGRIKPDKASARLAQEFVRDRLVNSK